MSRRDWALGTILKKLDAPRSYLFKVSAVSELRRNRIHLRPDQNPNNRQEICRKQITAERPDDTNETVGKKVESTQQQTESLAELTVPEILSKGVSTPKRTEHEKRNIKKLARFQDCV
ncbi:hypothetical protein AVEN_275630-1 [Araneus ventricosus]|uniref:DUF5641 domain-containing protein n=1 Tax=Araneus ventricosus TaxID=182803 RepID=A0A4Y2R719_ARAVE|nr:hypothetical protein AVEN_275630-1 [Araneus ventricosus]